MSEQPKTASDTTAEEVAQPEIAEAEVVEGEVAAAEEAAEAPTVEELQARLAEVEKALAEADLRAQAEVQNMRRRAERDVANARKFALEKFASDVVSVADTLERALTQLPADDESLTAAREGTELTLKVLLDVFKRHHIERIDPVDEAFNPEHHEAMAMVPMPGKAPNTVIEVLEKGYVLNDRLLRPARVVVAKGE